MTAKMRSTHYIFATMNAFLLILISGYSSAKTCHDLYTEMECIDTKTFMKCSDYDYDNHAYKSKELIKCPKDTRCVCMLGEECQEDQMCRKLVKPRPFVDVGMMTWKKTYYSDCSGCDESTQRLTQGFRYKLPNGRMFTEELTIRNRGEDKTDILYIPNEDGFTKYTWRRSSVSCEMSEVSKSDSLVFKNLNGFRESSLSGRKQHWEKKLLNFGAAQEEYWNYHTKEYKGKLIPISYDYSYSQDGLGDGESTRVSYSFNYLPKLSNYNLIIQREKRIIANCQK